MGKVDCIITGCDLLIPGHMRVHGDLHITGHAYIFNAVLTRDGETAWQYDRILAVDHGRHVIIVEDPRAIFERRGIIVVATENARLTEAAAEYVKRWA